MNKGIVMAALANQKRIEMYDCSTGNTMQFDSITIAARYVGVLPQRVSEQVNGRTKTLKRKYKFKFI